MKTIFEWQVDRWERVDIKKNEKLAASGIQTNKFQRTRQWLIKFHSNIPIKNPISYYCIFCNRSGIITAKIIGHINVDCYAGHTPCKLLYQSD